MALVFPASVGGTDEPATQLEKVEPIELRVSALKLPESVGGRISDPAQRGEPEISPFPEQREETRAAKELPELGTGGLLSGENKAKIAAVVPLIAVTTNNSELADILVDSFDSLGKSFDPGGNELLTNNETGAQVIVNSPDMSRLDLLQAAGIASAFTPAGRGATLTGGLVKAAGASAGKVLGATAAAGAATSGLTQGVIEGIQSQVGGELDESEIAIASALGGAAELVVPAIQSVRQARNLKKVGAASREIDDLLPTIQAGEEASRAADIPLFQAQQTGVPAQLEKQSFVAQLPAGTQSAMKGLKLQNKKAGDAVDKFINQIAPDDSVIVGAENVRTAAERALENAKNIRTEKTSPLYNEALEAGADVDLTPLREFIETEMKDLPGTGEISKSLKKVMSLTGAKESSSPSLKFLHNAKLEVDQMLKSFKDGGLGNTTKRKVTQAQSMLVDQIDSASPLYKAARNAFEEASPPVTKIQNSIIGKIANLDDTQLQQVTTKLFNPSMNASLIGRAKKSITDVDPQAWQEIVRTEFERRLGSMKPEGEEFVIENIPGQMHAALFPNEKSTKVLFAALDDEGKKNLKFLQTALGRARLGRPGGSQTAGRTEMIKELESGFWNGVRNYINKPLTLASDVGQAAVSTVTGATQKAGAAKNTAALAKALYDPTWKAEMSAIRRLGTKSPASGRAITQLLKEIDATQEQEQ